MKPHRNILLITLFIIAFSILFIVIFNENPKLFNIFMSILCSGIIAFIVELPNFLYLKQITKNQIYSIPLQIYTKLLLYKSVVNDYKNGKYIIKQDLCKNEYNEIDNLVTIFKQIDDNYFILNDSFIKHKQCFINLTNTLKILHLKLQTSIAKLNLEKLEAQLPQTIFPAEIERELSNITDSIDDFINYIDLFVSEIFNKKQYKTWQTDTTNILTAIKQFQ